MDPSTRHEDDWSDQENWLLSLRALAESLDAAQSAASSSSSATSPSGVESQNGRDSQ